MLVALHGFTGGGGDFEPLADALPEWRWRTPILPGHAPDVSQPNAPDDDCTLAASLKYLNSLISEKSAGAKILLGYSLGGRLALRYALAHPDHLAALVLIGTSPGLLDEAERQQRRAEDKALAQEILVMGVAAFLDEWQRHRLIASQARLPEAWQAAMRERRSRLRATGLAASLDGFGQGTVEPVWDRLGELRLPVMICAGAEDEKYAAQAKKMAEACASAELLIVPAAGHMAHLENLPAFATGLRSFVARHRLESDFK
jgi:2-succinyl-6-hydroxy-2,4-cyclohexadiene-1-carboxylate synthase